MPLAPTPTETQPFGTLPGEVTQGRQIPVGQHPLVPVRGIVNLDAQLFPFVSGFSSISSRLVKIKFRKRLCTLVVIGDGCSAICRLTLALSPAGMT